MANTRNIAKCAKCGTIIESTWTHHFITCECGAISIDGGRDYHRGIGNPEDCLTPSPEEIEAYDFLPTGRLENWSFESERGILWGALYDDKLRRWEEGTVIHTSSVANPLEARYPGAIITTNNSKYLLGKEYVKEKK